jgi:dihydroflavonol-4-reductase
MHYFVTGATGSLGGYLTSRLLAEGHLVTALVRTPEQARALARYGVRSYIGDVLDKESVRRAMRRAEGVFHLAGYVQAGINDRRRAEAVNVAGTRHVLEVMRDLRIPKGVYTSSLVVNGDTRGRVVDESYQSNGRLQSAYQRTKWKAHYEVALPLMRRGLPLVIALPGVIYGPGDQSDLTRAIGSYLRGRLLVVPTRTAFCFAHAEDVAAGLLGAMERGKPGESYILGGPAHSLRDVLRRAGELAGKRRGPLPLPWWALLPAAWGAQGLAFALPALRGAAERLRLGAGTTQLGDDAKARAQLGFAPRSVDEGLPDTVRSILQDLFGAS